MPVHLRSIAGKVDYEIEQLLRDLVRAVNDTENETQVIVDQQGGVSTQIRQLSTTVGSLGDLARRTQVINTKVTNILNGTTPAATVVWGTITGTLSNQLDLQAALDLKQNIMVFDQTLKAYVLDPAAQPQIL